MKRIAALVSIAALAGAVACNDDEDEAPETQESQEAEEGEPEAEEGEPEAREGDPEAEEGAPAEQDLADAEEVSAADLLEGFEEAQDEWMGKAVAVEGLYHTTNTANDEIDNIVVVASEDHSVADDPSVTCSFTEAPESIELTQFDEVTVRGSVDEFFDEPMLEECAIVD